MAIKKRQTRQLETIAACANCRRTHIMRGSAAQLKREGSLRCPRCKGTLAVVMEVERL
jgi:DNA-directed RNA polymerase subunit RPC12/RpoP